jgi:hypothetical protein
VSSSAKHVSNSVHIILESSISICPFHTEKEKCYSGVLDQLWNFTLRNPLKDLSSDHDVAGIVAKMELAL